MPERLERGPLVAIAFVVVLILGCGEAAPTPTPTLAPTPIPTAAPAPTNTPSPTPTSISAPTSTTPSTTVAIATSTPTPTTASESAPTSEPAAILPPTLVALPGECTRELRAIEELLAVVPAEYESVLVLDLEAVLADPGLREALEREGVLAALGPAAGPIEEQVDTLALATGGVGVLGVVQGRLDVQGFIEALKPPESEVSTESYRQFEILQVDLEFIITLKLAISLLDRRTAVFAISFSSEVPSADLVKAALDAVDETAATYLSHPVMDQLLDGLPQGFFTLVTRGCGSPPEHEGCLGSAISQAMEDEEVVSTAIFAFSSPQHAGAALPSIKAEVSEEDSVNSFQVSQGGSRVRLVTRGDVREAIPLNFGR